MKNFKEIAEKCLNGELFGVFKLSNGSYIESQFLCKSALTKEYYFLDPRCRGRRYDEYGLCMFSTQFHVINFIPALDKSDINMKQERNVKLTLEKAKEWYKKGGELKEVALQAFNEDELKEDPKPKSWEEYCKNYKGKWYCVSVMAEIIEGETYSGLNSGCAQNVLPSKELAEAFLAMMQLMSLRQAWIGDWKPDWNNADNKYCIIIFDNRYTVDQFSRYRQTLSFPTVEMAEDFMNCFKDLLEIVKPLL